MSANISPAGEVYPASPIKRHRATESEMEERAEFLIDYASQHAPVTVRQLYYQAEVAGLPGIEKTEAGYAKVQHQVLELRRQGLLCYSWIADSTRQQRRPYTSTNMADALESAVYGYRRSLWQDADADVEIWIEKDALAGVVYQVTSKMDVPLMVSRGFTSETFVYEAIEAYAGSERPVVVYALYDFDRSGEDATRSLNEKLIRFGDDSGLDVRFNVLALTVEQVEGWNLPTRPHKRATVADRRWPYPYACELDAIPPDDLRTLVHDAIEQHLPAAEFAKLLKIEAAERAKMEEFLSCWDETQWEAGA